MKLSLISPSRNNLKYLRWSYASVRKNCSPDVEYCVAVDFSDDGTEEWCKETAEKDPNFKYIVKEQHKRWGHTIWYDVLIEEVATGDIVMIWHADMYATPDMDKRILEQFENGENHVISLTRVEPPLHPPGAEKYLADFGIEPEEFDEERFLRFASDMSKQNHGKTKTGIFAPWALRREAFIAIGGHDPLFAPQSREDSDIFNRLILAGHETIQLFDVYVYHMTCRGSRFAGVDLNAELQKQEGYVRTTSDEWMKHNRRSERNFVRKWGTMVRTDSELKPVIPPKYKITYVIQNCNLPVLSAIEPYATQVFVFPHPDFKDTELDIVEDYIESEQKNTAIELRTKVHDGRMANPMTADILITFDGNLLSNENYKFITQMSEILAQSGEIGEFTLDIFKIQIFNVRTYEQDLVKLNKTSKMDSFAAYLENDNLP